MKVLSKIVVFSFSILGIVACETRIYPELEKTEPVVAVDAWLTRSLQVQAIRLTYSQEYFDNTVAEGVSGAEVRVIDEDGLEFVFEEAESGFYNYTPVDTFGVVGKFYFLEIQADGNRYYSTSQLNDVPSIDSITWRFEEAQGNFIDSSYYAEFWARDLLGEGDTYWIKTWKNGEYLNKPNEINIAYDAGFSAGGVVDNLIFIQPIRDLINPFDEYEDGENSDFQFRNPYDIGDAITVEIHGITNEAWFFLSNVNEQTNRPGGFAELFATPISNVSTNIISENEDVRTVGFFNIGAVSSASAIFTREAIRVVEE